ncbi:MAG: EF-P beta-lysylation protein EpmB [Gammaproteobacteria bacterium]|nr:EF-P beta-lysylation protein EpmB [Gammaproteobacteria bacterium]
MLEKPLLPSVAAADNADGIHALRASLRQALKKPTELCKFLELDERDAPEAVALSGSFSALVTREFAERMRPGDWQDPLLRQVLPLETEYRQEAELPVTAGWIDAVGDMPATLTPGLIHKYDGRALVISHGACAIHCRYCFRRHFPYGAHHAGGDKWPQVLAALADDSRISEVILSGGDPLMHTDSVIARQITDLAQIAHVHTVRLHTRVPVVCPSRVGPALLDALAASRLRPVIVLHINHANEIDNALAQAVRGLSGVAWVLNQSVLLAGINDSARDLIDLSRALFTAGVVPYYLHMLDEVSGAMHFRVDLARAQSLHEKMQESLPGYLVPRLVRERAGASAKLWVNRSAAE